MDDLIKPQRPLIPSLLSATRDAENHSNRSKLEVIDSSGLCWRIAAKASQFVSPQNPRALSWKIEYALSAKCTVADLVKTRTIELPHDQRLATILKSFEPILFETGHTTITAKNERTVFHLANQSIRERLQEADGQDFYSLKRSFLYKMIEDKCSFI